MKAKVSAQSFLGFALLALIGVNLILAFGPRLFSGTGLATDSVHEGFAVATFIANFALVAAIMCGFGYAVTGYLSGIALSSWNDYSLSRLQMTLWTIVVLAGLLTVVLIRLLSGVTDPLLNVRIPGELLVAMGIAAFTTAAAPAILALKASQDPDVDQIAIAQQRVSQTTGTSVSGVSSTGNAMGRVSQATASWLDLVTGDEAANAGIVDISKVQQLLITILLLGAYCGSIIRTLAQTSTGAALAGLPSLDSQFVELLAVSHAGYLVYKAAPKSGQTVTTDAVTSAYGATKPSAPSGDTVTQRLAIEDAANTTGLQLAVDGNPTPIGSDGFAEIELMPGIAHTITAQGSRGGGAVRGTLTVAPTSYDIDSPLSLELK